MRNLKKRKTSWSLSIPSGRHGSSFALITSRANPSVQFPYLSVFFRRRHVPGHLQGVLPHGVPQPREAEAEEPALPTLFQVVQADFHHLKENNFPSEARRKLTIRWFPGLVWPERMSCILTEAFILIGLCLVRICWSFPLCCIKTRRLNFFWSLTWALGHCCWKSIFLLFHLLIYWRKFIDSFCFYLLLKVHFMHARQYTSYSTVNKHHTLNKFLPSQSHSVIVFIGYAGVVLWIFGLNVLSAPLCKCIIVFVFIFVFTFPWTCFRSRMVNICEADE